MTQQQTAKPEQWTDEQWRAIIEKGNNLLVAAAAGSGKTSVLVERIIRKVTDPSDPISVDQLLVVTFTNAAAAEMRHRIGDALRKAIEEQPQATHLRRQLTLLARASITTLHSFCLELLRQYYYVVELDPDFRIADPMEAELLRQDVLEAKLEEWYEHDPRFQALADRLVDGQDDAGLTHLLLRIYEFSRSHPQPIRWLQEVAASFDVSEHAAIEHLPWGRSILRALRLELQGLVAKASRAVTLAAAAEGPNAYVPVLEAEVTALRQAAEMARMGWEHLRQAIAAVTFQRLPAVKNVDPELKEQVQELRDSVKKRIKALEEEYFSVEPVQYLRDLGQMAEHMETLARLVEEFDYAYQREKRARSLVDFGDLEHIALDILARFDEAGIAAPTEVALGLQARFAEVMVDEYQDINLVQETILQMVSRNGAGDVAANRFMVGDVKQSIYRFRLAEPGLFLQKYEEYLTDVSADESTDAGVRIDLAANFRSRREVVDAVNYLFRLIMTPRVGELSYDRAAELICRASYPEVDEERLQAEVHLIDRTAPEDTEESADNEAEGEILAGTQAQAGNLAEEASVAQMEARLIARRIRKWMSPGEGEKPLLVFDKKAGGLRPVAYRDIVILLRATAGWGQTLQEELRAAGIPVFAEQTGGYFAAPEVELMLSLLRIIDNPLQDIPLAAVLRSPIGNLREEELAQIRIAAPAGAFHQAVTAFLDTATPDEPLARKLRGFYARLNRWRTEARRGTLASLISRIYQETGYLDYVTAMENGQQRRANLQILYDRANQYEASSYRGLYRFLRFVDRLQEAGNDLGEARTVGETEDVVRIMTIHKSKGLEFPVVFVAGLGKQFNTMDLKSSFLLHKELGFGPYMIDPELRLRYPTLAMLGIRHELRRELLAEEMRVLYVALTRAREKLILVGTAKNLGKSITAWGQQGDTETLADEDLQQAKGYLDWIGRALIRHQGAKALRTYVQEKTGAPAITVATIRDDARFSYHFYQADEWVLEEQEKNQEAQHWDELVNRQAVADRPRDEQWRAKIEQALNWRDPHRLAATTAAKWSVSDLKQRHTLQGGMPYRLPRITQTPQFLSMGKHKRFTAAELGTILHTVMQHLDMRQPLDEAGITVQINRLLERDLLTPEQAGAIRVSQIAAFFATELGQRLTQARHIYRELPFTLAIPAATVRSELGESDERIIVQGVIDCMFEDEHGQLVLLDFKTDAIAREATDEAIQQLRMRYGEQLRYYCQAVATIWRRPVAECYLYLFAGGFSLSFPTK